MSDSCQAIVDIEVGPQEAELLAARVRSWLVKEGIIEPDPSDCVLGEDEGHEPGPRYTVALGEPGSPGSFGVVDGVCFPTDRRVYDAGENGIELTCPGCTETFTPEDEWMDAVGAWYEGDDEASFPCPACGKAQRLTEWRGPWPWGFGHLAVEFWNWPPLSPAFVEEVGRRLGHRIVLVRCHR